MQSLIPFYYCLLQPLLFAAILISVGVDSQISSGGCGWTASVYIPYTYKNDSIYGSVLNIFGCVALDTILRRMEKVPRKVRLLIAAHPRVVGVTLGVFFAFLAVAGQVGENVTLPLWAGAASSNCSYYRNNTATDGIMDNFFILSFASTAFVIVFGLCTLVTAIFDFKTIKENLKFPQWQLLLIGVCDAFNGILVVFSASSSRTAPFLQAILGNITIPLTILLR